MSETTTSGRNRARNVGTESQNSPEQTASEASQSVAVVTPVVTSEAIDSDLQAIIDAWSKMSGEMREAMVNLIQGMRAGRSRN